MSRRSVRRSPATLTAAGATALALVLGGCADEGSEQDFAEREDLDIPDVGEQVDPLPEPEPEEPLDGPQVVEEPDVDLEEGTGGDGIPGTVVVAGQPLLELVEGESARADLAALRGQPAIGTQVPVRAVPAAEGFWVGTDAGRIWVQLANPEQAAGVQPGDTVSFEGVLVESEDGFVDDLVLPSEDEELIEDLDSHIRIPMGAEVTVG